MAGSYKKKEGRVALAIDRTLEPVFGLFAHTGDCSYLTPCPTHTTPNPVPHILPTERACQFGVGEAAV